MKFLHAADLHVDSPLRGLANREGAPVERIRLATRHALANLVDLALQEEVRFVLIAGDLYDGSWQDYDTGLFFTKQMARLSAAGVKVFIVAGNHDAQSQITRNLRLPQNCHWFDSTRAGSVILEDHGVAIHGQSFPRQKVSEDLSVGYPPPVAGCLNIGVLHTSAEGSDDHDTYAPCKVEALSNKGYQYWALGHVHHRAYLSQSPWVVFPGNTQGRHAKETGPKGCVIVEAEGARIVSVQPRELDVVRWYRLGIDVSASLSEDDLLESVQQSLSDAQETAGDRLAAVRLSLEGRLQGGAARLAADHERLCGNIRALALEFGTDRLWIEKIGVNARPIARQGQGSGADALQALEQLLGRLDADAQALASLLAEDDIKALKTKLPPELKQGDDVLDLDDPAVARRLAASAGTLLLDLLAYGGQ